MKTFGVIDLGTNSVRLLIADSDGQVVVPRASYVRSTRLGEGMHLQARLLPEAMERTLAALAEYRAIAADARVDAVSVVATSAVREAVNGKEFAARVRQELGWAVEVIDGEEEARLSYLGALLGVGGDKEGALVLDIGGGSSELAMERDGALGRVSVQVGAVRMTQGGWSDDSLLTLLKPALETFANPKPRRVIGVGGTITSLAAVDLGLEPYDGAKVTGHVLTRDGLTRWENRLAAMTLNERRQVAGLQPQRADIILAGLAIARNIMAILDVDRLIASDWDLLHQRAKELGQKCDECG